MFDNDVLNIKEISGVLLKHPIPNLEYPFNTSYSTKVPSYRNELFIYLSGESTWTLGDTTFQIKAGDVVLIPRNVNREKYVVTTIEPTAFVDVFFVCDDINLSAPVLHRHPNEQLNNLFLKLGKLWLSKKDGYYTKSMSIFYDIINSIQTAEKAYLPLKKFEAMKPAIDYLEQNFYNPDFDYVHLANLSGFSYTYFKKLFIKKYGCAPVKHVTNLRINLARELILTSTYNLTEIARLCGFENVQYFSNTFKKIAGVSPSEYKKRQEEPHF